MISRAAGRPAYIQIADWLREQIRDGRYAPGAQLPTERELVERFTVSSRTVRVALDQLRGEGLAVSYQGRGVFVREQAVPRRLSTDIATSLGWYTTLARQGLTPAGQTRVTRAPCPPTAAEWLGIEPETQVVIRDRDLGIEGEPPIMVATSHFPRWVVDAAPDLADPNRGGMPELLRQAFGPTYSEDVLTVRMPRPAEQERLDLPPGTPVQVIEGATYDAEARPLHFIEVVAAGGRIEFAYRYGDVPGDSETGSGPTSEGP
jgi:GntR family transcriptional regulator